MTRKFPVGNIPEGDVRQNRLLPYNGKAVEQKSLVFSFTSFDRNHKLFNLGNDSTHPETLPGEWFLSLLDVLKEASTKSITELKTSSLEFHPVKWTGTNVHKPFENEQLEYWQFRISKARGRVIGFKIPIATCTVFYIVWLDAHHNLTDSEGYGTSKVFIKPYNAYDLLEKENRELRQQCEKLQVDLKVAEEMLERK